MVHNCPTEPSRVRLHESTCMRGHCLAYDGRAFLFSFARIVVALRSLILLPIGICQVHLLH